MLNLFGPLPPITLSNGLGMVIGVSTVVVWLLIFKALFGRNLDLSRGRLGFFVYAGLAVVVLSFFVEGPLAFLFGLYLETILIGPAIEEVLKAGIAIYTFKSERWNRHAQKDLLVWALLVGLATAGTEGLFIIYAFANVYSGYTLLVYSVARILPMHAVGPVLTVKGYQTGRKRNMAVLGSAAVAIHASFNFAVLPGSIPLVVEAWTLMACILLIVAYLVARGLKRRLPSPESGTA